MLYGLLLAAEEVVAPVIEETTVASTAIMEGWWVPLLGAVATGLGAILVTILKKLVDKLIAKMDASEDEKEALDALLVGVAAAEHDLVADIKAKASDGKLTKEEIKEVEAYALRIAKQELADSVGGALPLLSTWGTNKIKSLIKVLISKIDKEKPHVDSDPVVPGPDAQ